MNKNNIPLIFGYITLSLIILCLTSLGSIVAFRLLTGICSIITAYIYHQKDPQHSATGTLFSVIIWAGIGLINFYTAFFILG